MKVITLWQPWASWIARGLKTIETRTHHRFAGLVGSRIALHAGQKFDKTAIDSATPYVDDLDSLTINARHGEIICTAKVCDACWLDDSHSKAALIDCGNMPRFGLFLTDIEVVVNSGIIKGKQGIWNWEPYMGF
jgi:hypothetical protein